MVSVGCLTLAAGVTDQFGYFATGGPSGVGVAVGNAVRTTLIVVVSVTLLVSPASYGSNGNLNISG